MQLKSILDYFFTLSLMGLTVWMIVARFRHHLENNWALVYYACLLAYWKSYEGALNTYWVLGGVVSGLLLRFEFLGKIVSGAIRAVELAVFAYVLWRGVYLALWQ